MSGDPIYTEMIIEYSRNPSNYGKLENPHITRHDSCLLYTSDAADE